MGVSVEKVTQAGLDQLQQRLADDLALRERVSTERAEAYSRDGDGTHDNPSFHSLTAELEFVDRRIVEAQQRLATLVLIGDGDVDTKRIGIGTAVVCKITSLDGTQDDVVLQVVGEADSDPSKGMISHLAPVGAALMGLVPGDTAVISLPSGEGRYTVRALYASIKAAQDNQCAPDGISPIEARDEV